MTLKIGVIGAGRIGKLHADNLTTRVPGVSVVAIADVYEPAAQETAARLNIPHASANPQDVLTSADVEAVVICSSTDTHSQFIIEAAQAGKHIFCEKPVDLSLSRIDEAIAAVNAAGVKFQVGFNRRFDPNFRYVRQVITDGGIGEPHIVRITSRDPAPPPIEYVKVSGGIFVDCTIHDYDMMRFLMDSPVEEVYAMGSVLIDPAIGEAGDFDTAVTNLRFESGAIGIIDNSRQAVYGYDQRIEVLGSKGQVSAENNTPTRNTLSDANGVHQQKPLYFFLERYNDAYIEEMRAFVEAVTEDKPVPVTGADGRAPVVIAMAAALSATENRPVKISEVENAV